jgi:predicted transcriptional regulator
VTSSQVFKIMYPRRELSYSTIMLTMAKLSRKGILTQQRTGDKKTDAFIYTPNLSRREMGMRLLQEVSEKVLKNPLHVVVGKILSDTLSAADLQKVTSAIEAASK